MLPKTDLSALVFQPLPLPLVEPPTEVLDEAPLTETLTTPTPPVVQKDGGVEEVGLDEDPDEAEGSLANPPIASRFGKRYGALSRLSNQVKSLEINLQLTNR